MYFRCFGYSLLEKDMALHLKKLESPSPKNALCQLWSKLGLMVLHKILKILQCIFAISIISLLGNGALQLNFVPNLVDIGSVILESESDLLKYLSFDGSVVFLQYLNSA